MIKRILAGLVVFLATVAFGAYYLLSSHHATQLRHQGHLIRIHRDQHSIPHIYAPNRRSYLYALGYVTAEDRLFQMAMKRIMAQGRLSQFLGEKALPVDINMRDLGLHKTAIHIADKMKTEARESYEDIDSYAQGINQAAASRRIYPIQFHILDLQWQQWTVEDILTLQKMLEWSISHNLLDEYTRSTLLGNYSISQINKMLPIHTQNWAFKDAVTVKDHELPLRLINYQIDKNSDFETLQIGKIISMCSPQLTFGEGGSNAWVVSGKHTASGKNMLVADPHLDAILPSHWYQYRATFQVEGEEIRFAGVAFPGIPTPYGKNQYWAMFPTVLVSDTTDGFKQTIEGNKYMLEGEWRDLKARTELIKVKYEEGVRVINHTVKLTHRGPVINYLIGSIGAYDLRQNPISISWTGHNQDYLSFINGTRNNEIINFQQLKARLQTGISYSLSMSVMFATEDNHIGYAQFGINPIRPRSRLGSYISDGTSSKNDWLGTHKSQDRLIIIDPLDGYLVTSNNRPASSKFMKGYFDTAVFTARATRLQELIRQQIASGRKINTEFAKKTICDTVDIYCRQILPELISSLPQAREHLINFNCDFKPSSYQATIYELFMFELWKGTKPLPENNISYLSLPAPSQSLYNHIHKAYNGSQMAKFKLKEAWGRMLTRLETFYKSRDVKQWQWGLYHRDVAKHIPFGSHKFLSLFYNRQSAGWGNLHTPNLGRASKLQQGNFAIIQRANLRNIFDFGGPSYWISDSGASQSIFSKHYDDQWKLFMSEQMIPMYPDQNGAEGQLNQSNDI